MSDQTDGKAAEVVTVHLCAAAQQAAATVADLGAIRRNASGLGARVEAQLDVFAAEVRRFHDAASVARAWVNAPQETRGDAPRGDVDGVPVAPIAPRDALREICDALYDLVIKGQEPLGPLAVAITQDEATTPELDGVAGSGGDLRALVVRVAALAFNTRLVCDDEFRESAPDVERAPSVTPPLPATSDRLYEHLAWAHVSFSEFHACLRPVVELGDDAPLPSARVASLDRALDRVAQLALSGLERLGDGDVEGIQAQAADLLGDGPGVEERIRYIYDGLHAFVQDDVPELHRAIETLAGQEDADTVAVVAMLSEVPAAIAGARLSASQALRSTTAHPTAG